MWYSFETGGFYCSEIGQLIPDGAVELNAAEYLALINGVADGKCVIKGAGGKPELHDPQPAPPSVPGSITMRQARLCLHKHGMLAGVQPSIDALPEPDRTAAQIEWDYSSVVERRRGFVLTIAQSLGITDDQLDELFIEAATL